MPGGADVGGDWYDAIQLEDGRLGVAMGDVVGHGIGAASLMGQLRHAARAYALEGHSPAARARPPRPPRAQPRRRPDGHAALPGGGARPGVGAPGERRTRAAARGRPDGRGELSGRAPDPPLGVFDSAAHASSSAELEPGSTLVLYTDGLVEERGVSIDAGLEALREAAERSRRPGGALRPPRGGDARASTPPTTTSRCSPCARCPLRPAPLHLELRSDPDLLGLRAARARLAGCAPLGAGRRGHRGRADRVPRGVRERDRARLLRTARHASRSTRRLEDGRAVARPSRDAGSWVERPDGALPHRGHGLHAHERAHGFGDVSPRRGRARAVRLARRLACQPVDTCSSTHSNGSGTPASAIRVGRAVVYIDPYRVPEGAPPADLILVTHGHYDHFSPQDVERLRKRATWLVGPGGGGRARERAGALDRAGRDARGRARARRARGRGGRVQHLEARTPTASPSTRARRAGWATRSTSAGSASTTPATPT